VGAGGMGRERRGPSTLPVSSHLLDRVDAPRHPVLELLRLRVHLEPQPVRRQRLVELFLEELEVPLARVPFDERGSERDAGVRVLLPVRPRAQLGVAGGPVGQELVRVGVGARGAAGERFRVVLDRLGKPPLFKRRVPRLLFFVRLARVDVRRLGRGFQRLLRGLHLFERVGGAVLGQRLLVGLDRVRQPPRPRQGGPLARQRARDGRVGRARGAAGVDRRVAVGDRAGRVAGFQLGRRPIGQVGRVRGVELGGPGVGRDGGVKIFRLVRRVARRLLRGRRLPGFRRGLLLRRRLGRRRGRLPGGRRRRARGRFAVAAAAPTPAPGLHGQPERDLQRGLEPGVAQVVVHLGGVGRDGLDEGAERGVGRKRGARGGRRQLGPEGRPKHAARGRGGRFFGCGAPLGEGGVAGVGREPGVVRGDRVGRPAEADQGGAEARVALAPVGLEGDRGLGVGEGVLVAPERGLDGRRRAEGTAVGWARARLGLPVPSFHPSTTTTLSRTRAADRLEWRTWLGAGDASIAAVKCATAASKSPDAKAALPCA